jgi:hypothetical protein
LATIHISFILLAEYFINGTFSVAPAFDLSLSDTVDFADDIDHDDLSKDSG